MCGIAGIISPDPSVIKEVTLKKMADCLAHRGPDGEGYWISQYGHAGFGHRRLAIVDLSREAAQPMSYLDRYTIAYNGEIYNYPEIKAILISYGYSFKTLSDTEVILAAYDYYKGECLNHFDGMFALAIWDEKEQMLFAARDRFGEKPFYYSFAGEQFYFGSEKKALWAAGIEKEINHPLLLNFLVTGHTQTAADNSISFHQHIFSLPPAHYLELKLPAFSFDLVSYWDLDKETQIEMSEPAAAEKWKELFFTSVSRRLRSDVPLGTSLSGGLDSSSILAMIEKCQDPPNRENRIQTFSAVFPGFARDESHHIAKLIGHLHLDNYSVSPTADEFIREFEKLCRHQEEPFSSASPYAQFRVFELAKQRQVKVLLDGQGADETLAGYSKYLHWYLQELLRKHPLKVWRERRALNKNKIAYQWGWKNYLAALFPAQAAYQLEKREARKILHHPDISNDFKQQYFDRPSIYKPMVLKLNDILYFDCCRFGLEELLRFADRSSMAHGVETRLPYLNHELVQFLFSLPSHFKIKGGWTKWLLRKSMSDQLPGEIVWRTDKIGYEPPQKIWMENSMVQEYIQEARRKLVLKGVLNARVLDKKIQPQDAPAADNYDWRYLVASAFI